MGIEDAVVLRRSLEELPARSTVVSVGEGTWERIRDERRAGEGLAVGVGVATLGIEGFGTMGERIEGCAARLGLGKRERQLGVVDDPGDPRTAPASFQTALPPPTARSPSQPADVAAAAATESSGTCGRTP